MGRADLCLSQSRRANRWQAAEEEFRNTLTLIGPDLQRFASEAGEAHAGLGLVYLPPRGHGVRRAYVRARAEYRIARRITDDRRRAHLYARMLAYIARRLKESPSR